MKPFNPIRLLLLSLLLLLWLNAAHANAANECAPWQKVTVNQLHSSKQLDFCQLMAQRPVLIVNTASHCGFTGQFKGLEALYQRYKDRGLLVVGVPSNSFYQEAKDAATTAEVCYKNYGVSFVMTESLSVKGDDSHPLFRHLAAQTTAPNWNFNKYLVAPNGEVLAHFPSRIDPGDPEFVRAIETLL